MTIKSLTLAVVAGLALAISTQAQNVTEGNYLTDISTGALYGAWSSATITWTPTGMEVQSPVANGYGSGYFIVNSPQLANANDNALALTLTINTANPLNYNWFGPQPVILNDDLPPPTSYTYYVGYGGYGNPGNPANFVWNGNTVTITYPLAAGEISKIQSVGGDHVYSFNLGLDPAVINETPYDITFNSLDLIPEPATMSIVGIGAVLLGWISLRRRHTS